MPSQNQTDNEKAKRGLSYKVLYSATFAELQKDVDLWIQSGYIPVGGIAVNSQGYMQAVYKAPVIPTSTMTVTEKSGDQSNTNIDDNCVKVRVLERHVQQLHERLDALYITGATKMTWGEIYHWYPATKYEMSVFWPYLKICWQKLLEERKVNYISPLIRHGKEEVTLCYIPDSMDLDIFIATLDNKVLQTTGE